MILLYFLILSTVSLVNSSPVSYQYVSFVRNGRTRSSTDLPGRRSRSFSFENKQFFAQNHYWNDGDFHPHSNALAFEEHRGHFTPDFSDGLEYPDPFLLTGRAAKLAASYLYRKPLFFEEINHLDALLYNQEQRRRSGLAGNKLGSLRTQLPFYRFK
ncbi:uncharacterized protein LOC103312736 [Tribolium castaneum]|uniref:Uncharacterized protein n=1 Tax=Tribolium castaneum TaxID=7070 RepID=D1ZZX0_TRICA|nr:PREDICTED: uncharacterized protein LOC103312736 [Tribolium castaneum]EFA02433.2 hypothetical protein TcasGA2_TC008120 [Tribolium castaneum]|eukprot:XP_008192388.1 PREDICTED: uncharacterized protein LOC103312736 [Tribolium castaneum]